MIKAGKYTAALVLIVVGGLLLADLTLGTSYTAELIRWWPAVLISLGLEYLAVSVRHRADDRRIGIAAGSIALAVIVSLLVIGYNHSDKFNLLDFAIGNFVDESGESFDLGTTTVPLDENRRKVVLSNKNGNVEMRSGNVDGIQIHTTLYVSRLSGKKADEIAAQSKVDYRNDGSTLEIDANGKEYRIFGIRHHPRMNMVVTVPKRKIIDFELDLRNGKIDAEGIAVMNEFKAGTTNGSIDIRHIDGDVTAATTNGSILVEQALGTVSLKTTNGSIMARRIDGDVTTDSTNGKITLEQVEGKAGADTTNGKITLTDIARGISADTTNGSITIQSRTIGDDWKLETTNGGITVYLPKDAAFEVEGEAARHSRPESDFSLHTDKGEISGKVNGGGPKISIDTNSSVEILHLP